MVLNYLWLIWILSSLAYLRFYIYVARYLPSLISRPLKTRFGTPTIIFQITTKGNMPIVQNTVNQVHIVCEEVAYTKYELWVVTDAEEKYENCRTFNVPTEYSCNAAFKARALQYATEIRSREKKNTENIFIFHLDDESIITTQTLYSVLTFLEDKPKPISEGLIVYPLKDNEPMRISTLFDTIRPFCCFECVDSMRRGNPASIHGSNLLVRSDIEEKVGWNNGITMAEDSLFAFVAKQKFGAQVFGWHGGVIEEKSPKTLRDIIKQRKRWFYGLAQNLKYLSPSEKSRQLGRALLWSSGFISGLVSIFALLIPQDIPWFLRGFFLLASVLWLLSYQIGAFMNSRYLSIMKRFTFHILTLVASPFIGLIECSTPILAILRKPRTFEVIEK